MPKDDLVPHVPQHPFMPQTLK